MKFLILTVMLSFAGISAHADNSSEIVNSTVVTSTLALMQAKYANSCQTPKASDIHWMCTGALMPVSKLTLVPGGCGFAIDITCTGGRASIYGNTKTVIATDASGVRNDVAGLDLGVSFDGIQIN